MSKLPDFSEEKRLWKKYKIIAGLDEVGRGSFAGPVVAGAVIFNEILIPEEIYINDSKKLKPRERERASIWIKENALAYGIGVSSVTEINKFGIVEATNKAFRRSLDLIINNFDIRVSYLLIDAFYIPYVKGLRRRNQLPIVKGDSTSISIAAASIIAKVHRDSVMLKLSKDERYTKYGWGRNKGYGTKEHRDAIKKHGPTKYHRNLFVRKFTS